MWHGARNRSLTWGTQQVFDMGHFAIIAAYVPASRPAASTATSCPSHSSPLSAAGTMPTRRADANREADDTAEALACHSSPVPRVPVRKPRAVRRAAAAGAGQAGGEDGNDGGGGGGGVDGEEMCLVMDVWAQACDAYWVPLDKVSHVRELPPRQLAATATRTCALCVLCADASFFARGACRCGGPCAQARTRSGERDTCRSKAAVTLFSPLSTPCSLLLVQSPAKATRFSRDSTPPVPDPRLLPPPPPPPGPLPGGGRRAAAAASTCVCLCPLAVDAGKAWFRERYYILSKPVQSPEVPDSPVGSGPFKVTRVLQRGNRKVLLIKVLLGAPSQLTTPK